MIPRVSHFLASVLRGAGLESTSVIWRISESWDEIVGPRVAAHATPVRLRSKELTLSAPDAVWRQELTLLGPEIREIVNQKIGEDVVERVRLVSGSLRSPTAPRTRRRIRIPRVSTSAASDVATPEMHARSTPPQVAEALEALSLARSNRLREDRAALEAARRREPYSRPRRR